MLFYGNLLKKLRENLGESQTSLALKLDTTPQAIQRIEANKGNLNDELKLKLITLFGLNINWLLTGEGAMFLSRKNTFELKQKNIDYQNFGNRLCKLIEKSGLDLNTFAGVVDIKFEHLADLCVGKKPTIDEVISIVECFNITADYLLLGIEE